MIAAAAQSEKVFGLISGTTSIDLAYFCLLSVVGPRSPQSQVALGIRVLSGRNDDGVLILQNASSKCNRMAIGRKIAQRRYRKRAMGNQTRRSGNA
jgi:hypothetical protein